MAPPLRSAGLRGAMLGWDGQLEDDARLVTTVARTAASYGAHVRTRARVLSRDRHPVPLRDELTGDGARGHRPHRRQRDRGLGRRPGRRGQAAPQPRHPPGAARGRRCPDLQAAVFAPVPGRDATASCWCSPSPTARSYVGLTDEPADGPIPDVPEPTEPEIGFLLDVVGAAFERPLHRSDVVGAYAGLRPLLDVPAGRRDRRPRPAGTPCSPARPAWSRSSAAS